MAARIRTTATPFVAFMQDKVRFGHETLRGQRGLGRDRSLFQPFVIPDDISATSYIFVIDSDIDTHRRSQADLLDSAQRIVR
jgi:hypothetical protein